MSEEPWCVVCANVSAEAGSDCCWRCRRREEAGLPPLSEVRAEGERAFRERLVWYRGAYNGSVPE
jgi:hypothetical protein